MLEAGIRGRTRLGLVAFSDPPAEQEAEAPKRAQDEDPKTYMVPPHLEQEAEARRLGYQDLDSKRLHDLKKTAPNWIDVAKLLAKAEQERDRWLELCGQELGRREAAEARERELREALERIEHRAFNIDAGITKWYGEQARAALQATQKDGAPDAD